MEIEEHLQDAEEEGDKVCSFWCSYVRTNYLLFDLSVTAMVCDFVFDLLDDEG